MLNKVADLASRNNRVSTAGDSTNSILGSMRRTEVVLICLQRYLAIRDPTTRMSNADTINYNNGDFVL